LVRPDEPETSDPADPGGGLSCCSIRALLQRPASADTPAAGTIKVVCPGVGARTDASRYG
jgi:hypothetical protein